VLVVLAGGRALLAGCAVLAVLVGSAVLALLCWLAEL
jgi:hypothetical protein